MPSSTSSSELRREVPDRPWGTFAAVALLLALVAVAAWEVHCRAAGYAPFYNDTPAFWAAERDRVGPESHVLVGSSRIAFDVDTAAYEEVLGVRPVQLAIVGSCPRPILHDLAMDESFRGVAVVGVTPGLFFAAGGPLFQKSLDWLAARGRRTPSGNLSHYLGQRLEEHLAFLQLDDLSLRGLLIDLELPNRPGAIMPRLPPYLATIEADRAMKMTRRLAEDTAFQGRIQGIWKALLGAAPPMTPEQQIAARDQVLKEVVADVERLRARGARVVFLRPPSTGWFRELEAQGTPRADYWDLLLAKTGAPGIHFEDHPELSGFPCPEWSHLRVEDATAYTRALLPRLAPLLQR
jgi:hypothetical protein